MGKFIKLSWNNLSLKNIYQLFQIAKKTKNIQNKFETLKYLKPAFKST